tara:strand:+ start:501 stop:671 length:171 start_codon:yes stop_codon:yes gene_type:complete
MQNKQVNQYRLGNSMMFEEGTALREDISDSEQFVNVEQEYQDYDGVEYYLSSRDIN